MRSFRITRRRHPREAEQRLMDAFSELREAAEEAGCETLAEVSCDLALLWAAGADEAAQAALSPLVAALLSAVGDDAPPAEGEARS